MAWLARRDARAKRLPLMRRGGYTLVPGCSHIGGRIQVTPREPNEAIIRPGAVR